MYLKELEAWLPLSKYIFCSKARKYNFCTLDSYLRKNGSIEYNEILRHLFRQTEKIGDYLYLYFEQRHPMRSMKRDDDILYYESKNKLFRSILFCVYNSVDVLIWFDTNYNLIKTNPTGNSYYSGKNPQNCYIKFNVAKKTVSFIFNVMNIDLMYKGR